MSSTTPTSVLRNVIGLIRTISINLGFKFSIEATARITGSYLTTCPTCNTAPPSAAASAIAAASSAVGASGFSIKQATPRASSGSATSR